MPCISSEQRIASEKRFSRNFDRHKLGNGNGKQPYYTMGVILKHWKAAPLVVINY